MWQAAKVLPCHSDTMMYHPTCYVICFRVAFLNQVSVTTRMSKPCFLQHCHCHLHPFSCALNHLSVISSINLRTIGSHIVLYQHHRPFLNLHPPSSCQSHRWHFSPLPSPRHYQMSSRKLYVMRRNLVQRPRHVVRHSGTAGQTRSAWVVASQCVRARTRIPLLQLNLLAVSFKPTSCKPNAICQSLTSSFSDLSRVQQDATKWNGNVSEYDWVGASRLLMSIRVPADLHSQHWASCSRGRRSEVDSE